MLRRVEGTFTAALRGATSVEQLSVGFHPRLIYDAAAAAKNETLVVGWGRSLLVSRSQPSSPCFDKISGHSLSH
jgi:hypothetical protein